MADWLGAAGDLLGGLGSLFGGGAASKGYKEAASTYRQAAAYSQLSTGLKEIANQRQVYQTLGAGRAVAASSGLRNSGTVTDVLRSSAQQGALSRAMIGLQGKIEYEGYIAQADTADAQAQASQSSGIGGFLGGVLGAASMFI